MVKISIIVPIYNSEKYIEKCIDSIINQSIKEIEIVLINDGSTDKSALLCEKIKNKYDNVIVIHQENGGVSAARNKGIEVASGEYVGFVDSDDYIQESMFEILFKQLIKQEDIDLVGCRFFESKSLHHEVYEKELSFEEIVEACCTEILGGFVCNKLFKMKIIKENNLKFNTHIGVCEDYIFCLDYIKYCRKGFFIDEPLYHYIDRPNSVTKIGYNKERWSGLEAYDIILKHCCIENNSKVERRVENNYIEYCLWLAKAIMNAHLNDKEEYINTLKKRIKNYRYNFMINKRISIKYKMGMIILYTYPKLFKLFK